MNYWIVFILTLILLPSIVQSITIDAQSTTTCSKDYCETIVDLTPYLNPTSITNLKGYNLTEYLPTHKDLSSIDYKFDKSSIIIYGYIKPNSSFYWTMDLKGLAVIDPWWNSSYPNYINITAINTTYIPTNYSINFTINSSMGVAGSNICGISLINKTGDAIGFEFYDDYDPYLEVGEGILFRVKQFSGNTPTDAPYSLYFNNTTATDCKNSTRLSIKCDTFDKCEYVGNMTTGGGWIVDKRIANPEADNMKAVTQSYTVAKDTRSCVFDAYGSGSGYGIYWDHKNYTTNYSLEWYGRVNTTTVDAMHVSVRDGNGGATGSIGTEIIFSTHGDNTNGQLTTYDGGYHDYFGYVANQWYQYKVKVDLANNKMEIFVNGTDTNNDRDFRNADNGVGAFWAYYHANIVNYYIDDLCSFEQANAEPTVFMTGSIQEQDSVPPAVNITYPLNDTYASNSIWINATTDDSDTSWCGFSLNSTPNVTLQNTTGNWNNLTSLLDGKYRLTVCCNDTTGNMNCTANVNFTVYIPPVTFANGSYSIDVSGSLTSFCLADNTTLIRNGTLNNQTIELSVECAYGCDPDLNICLPHPLYQLGLVVGIIIVVFTVIWFFLKKVLRII